MVVRMASGTGAVIATDGGDAVTLVGDVEW
jgi:hypothetical protein